MDIALYINQNGQTRGIIMMKLGEFQTLICIKKVEFGIYLAERKDSEDKVLLPAKQVPE